MRNSPPRHTVSQYFREGSFDHFPGVLNEEPSWILRKLIPLLSANIRIEPAAVERIKELARVGPVVYAMKYRSVYDLHFLRLRFAELGLPVPAFVFGLSIAACGSLKKSFAVWKAGLKGLARGRTPAADLDESTVEQILQNGGAGVVFLVDEQTFRARYVHPERDPLQILLDVQGRLAGSMSIVPIFIIYDRTPRRTIRPFWDSFLGDPDRPGLLRRLVIAIRKWTVPEVLVGEPVHPVGEFEEFGSDKNWEDLPFQIRQQMLANINALIRVNRGPEKLSRTEIKERVLREERVRKAVGEIAARENKPSEKIRKQAEAYVEEIASDQRIQVHHFFYYFLGWMFSHVFDGIDLKESQFPSLKVAGRKGSLVFVPCHKSHFDYLIIGYLSFINRMAVPLIAAGKNLSFWPVGPLIRRAGAFFLRRSFKGKRLYTEVFAAYVKVVVQEQHNIKFYIEGGRSRTGRFLQPRLGLLTFLLTAVEEGSVEDLYFVPTFMGYDQIPEEASYLRELTGLDKKKETILTLIRGREVLKKRYGKVYVRFHDPLSFRGFCSRWKDGADLGNMSEADTRQLHHDFAEYLMAGIVRVGVVTPIDLTAAALTCHRRLEVNHSRLVIAVQCLSDAIRSRNIEFGESLQSLETGVEAALGLFSLRGLIDIRQPLEGSGEKVYFIYDQKRVNLEFYRNALVNFLWPASILSMVLLQQRLFSTEITPPIREEFLELKRILSRELIYDPLEDDESILEHTFDLFRREGWLVFPEGEQATGERTTPLVCLRGILADLVAVYYLILETSDEMQEAASQKELAKRIMRRASDLSSEGEVPSVQAVSPVTVGNALARFHDIGILGYEEAKKTVKAVRNHVAKDAWKQRLAGALGMKSHLP